MSEPDALAFPAEPEVWTPSPWPTDCPKPGIYLNLPYETYAAWPAINASALKHGAELSPKHMRAGVASGKDTRARKFGRAIHCRLLEGPEAFGKRFMVAEDCCQKLKSGPRKGKACGATGKYPVPWGATVDAEEGELDPSYAGNNWYCEKHQPKGVEEPADYVSDEECQQTGKMIKAIYAHPSVGLIRTHGGCEVSIVWERDGMACKARIDKLILDAACPDTIVDLKKCQAFHISQHELEKSIVDYYWDLQAYWYREAVKSIRPDPPPGEPPKPLNFIWLFAEDNEPYDVCPMVASDAWIETGRCRASRALRLYRDALMSGEWIGVANEIVESFPPKYHATRYGAN